MAILQTSKYLFLNIRAQIISTVSQIVSETDLEISIESVNYNGGNYVPGVRHEMTLEIDVTDVDSDPSFDVTAADEAEFDVTFSFVDVDISVINGAAASGTAEDLLLLRVQLTEVNSMVIVMPETNATNATTVLPPADLRQFTAAVSVSQLFFFCAEKIHFLKIKSLFRTQICEKTMHIKTYKSFFNP